MVPPSPIHPHRKLDRLHRDAEFLLKLQREGVKFVAADMPDANDLTIGIIALVEQLERTPITRRTKEALAAAKARGVKLGNPNGAAHMLALKLRRAGVVASAPALKKKPDGQVSKVIEVMRGIQAEGIMSLGHIAAEPNRKAIVSPRGGSWYA